MSDLVAFLNTRLDEDEAAAGEIHLARTCDCIDRDGDFHMFPGEACGCEYPARVLREVDAKRRILERHKREVRVIWRDQHGVGEGPPFCSWCSDQEDYPWPCPDVRALAAVYSGHPDYDPAWASLPPDGS